MNMANLKAFNKRELEILRRVLKEGTPSLTPEGLAIGKAELRKRLESPELSNEERLRTERHLAGVERAEQRLLEWQSKHAHEPGSTINHEVGSKGERALLELEDLWRFADEGPRSKGILSLDEMNQAKARRQWE
jgi:hypothetical protein